MSKRLVYPDGTEAMQLFLYDGDNEIGSTDTSGTIRELRILGHTARAERSAVAFELHGKTYFPLPDLFGNVSCLLSKEGQVESYEYDAFGNENAPEDPISPWRYAAKRVDFESDLIYFGRRYYDPVVGIWLTPDPAGYTKGLNLYAYVCNDPLMSFDLYGLESIEYYLNQGSSLDRDISIVLGASDFAINSFAFAGTCFSYLLQANSPTININLSFSERIEFLESGPKNSMEDLARSLGHDVTNSKNRMYRDLTCIALDVGTLLISLPSAIRSAGNIIRNLPKWGDLARKGFRSFSGSYRLAGEQFAFDRKIGNFFVNEKQSNVLLKKNFSNLRHFGQIKAFKGQNPKQLMKSIKSFQKRIDEHNKWINNPKIKVKNWDRLSDQYRQNLLHHWRKDAERANEFKLLAEEILREKLG